MPALTARSGAATDAAILDAIRREPDTTRIAIARELGVTPATVTNSVKRLLAAGLVVESGRARSTGGKPASLLRVSTTSRWAIGCTLESDRLALVAMGMGGALRGRVMMPLPAGAAPERIAELLEAGLRDLGALERSERDAFQGVGITDLRPRTEGSRTEGITVLAAHLEEAVDRPVVRGTPAVCAGLGSDWVGEQEGGQPCLTVHLGPTVGIALLLGGRPLLPWGDEAGELDVPDAGTVADVRRALAEGLGHRIDLDTAEERVITAHARLTEAAAHGDTDAAAIVSDGARRIARAVDALAGPLGVRSVVLSGTSVAMAPRLYLDTMSAVLPAGRRLRVSTVQPHPCAVGAAALALVPRT
jgi:predicted NBD/HSP70 family sugar kinase